MASCHYKRETNQRDAGIIGMAYNRGEAGGGLGGGKENNYSSAAYSRPRIVHHRPAVAPSYQNHNRQNSTQYNARWLCVIPSWEAK